MICGKIIYTSRSEASKVIRGVNKNPRHGDTPNRLNTTYYCDACQGWHVASRCTKKKPRTRTVEFKESNQELHNLKMKKFETLIIRNYSSRPIK